MDKIAIKIADIMELVVVQSSYHKSGKSRNDLWPSTRPKNTNSTQSALIGVAGLEMFFQIYDRTTVVEELWEAASS